MTPLSTPTTSAACCLQGITDGEFRRDYWHLDFMKQLDDLRFLKQSTRRTAKLCIPSPGSLHFRGGRNDLADAGCTYLGRGGARGVGLAQRAR